jgi:hypothetical protein
LRLEELMSRPIMGAVLLLDHPSGNLTPLYSSPKDSPKTGL